MKIKYYLIVSLVLVFIFISTPSITRSHDESLHTEPVSIWHNFFTAFGFDRGLNVFQIAAVPTSLPTIAPTPQPSSIVSSSDVERSSTDILVDKIVISNTQLANLSTSTISIRIAEKRQELMKSLAIKDAGRFLGVTLNEKVRSKLLPEAQKYVEKREVKQGRLEILHIDDFKLVHEFVVKNEPDYKWRERLGERAKIQGKFSSPHIPKLEK